VRFEAWGWSRVSEAEAEKIGLSRARQALERFLKNHDRRHAAEYDYLDMPIREEVLEEIGPADQPTAAITRNRYGSLILNTAGVLFADVDFPPAKARGFLDAFLMLFSPERKQQREEETRQATLSGIKTWILNHPQRGVRLYRTAAGLRLLFTDRTYQPTGEESLGLLRELGSDALYIRLTRKQESFRARLSPKPWRCGVPAYPALFPVRHQESADRKNAWLEDYRKKSAGFRVCDLLTVSGRDSADPVIRAIVDLHDRHACQPRAGKLA
jgi:hypothetical protein